MHRERRVRSLREWPRSACLGWYWSSGPDAAPPALPGSIQGVLCSRVSGDADSACVLLCWGFVGAEHSYGVLGYPASGAQRMVASLAVAM